MSVYEEFIEAGLAYLSDKRPVLIWNELPLGGGCEYGFAESEEAREFKKFLDAKFSRKLACQSNNFFALAMNDLMKKATEKLGYRKTDVRRGEGPWQRVKWEPAPQ